MKGDDAKAPGAAEHRLDEGTLLESEAGFRTMAENLPDIVARCDRQLRYVFMNDQIEAVTGIPAEAFLGRTNREAGMPEDLTAQWEDCLSRVFATRQRVALEFIYPSPQGERYFESRLCPELAADGTVQTVLCLTRDITERRRVAERLQRSELLLKETQHISKVGGWLYDVDTKTVTWTDETYRIHALSYDYDPGDPERNIQCYAPQDQVRISEAFYRAVEFGEPYDLELQLIAGDGTVKWVRTSGRPLRQLGRVTQIIGNIIDITERKRAEEALAQRTALLTNLLDSIPDMVFFKDREGVYLGCNPVFAEFVGRSRETIVGYTDYDLFEKDSADSFRENDRLMMERGEARHNEEWIVYPNGRRVLLDTLKSPLHTATGECIGIIGVSRDITARKQAENDLLREKTLVDAILDSTPGIIYLYTAEGKLVRWNRKHEELTGYSAGELSRMTLLDWYVGDEKSQRAVIEGVKRTMETGFGDAEADLQTKDGRFPCTSPRAH